jgi:fructose-bisphosphate aldolase class I
MNNRQYERIHKGQGFIAALDQSGGSTPKALAGYGIQKDQYSTEEQMFDLVHAMRSRMISSPAFTSNHILGAILFEQTMDRTIDDFLTGEYLWEVKSIVPFLKVDQGLAELADGVQLMKPLTNLDELLERALARQIFGTKMRSVIKTADSVGIKNVVDQQFDYGKRIIAAGLVPIIEPEIDIHSLDKSASEQLLKLEILKNLDDLAADQMVMLKLSIPEKDDFYLDLIKHPRVLRVVALSGGYSRAEADLRLARNHGLIASFSRALAEGLSVQQTENAFNDVLRHSIEQIYEASIT